MKRSCHPNLTDGKFAKSNPFHFKTTHKRLIFNYFKELLTRFNGTAMRNYKHFIFWLKISRHSHHGFPKSKRRELLKSGGYRGYFVSAFTSWFRKPLQEISVRKIEKITRRYSYEDSEYCTFYYDVYGMRHVIPKKWIEDTIWVPFEDIQIRIPKYYHEYLTHLYGDYMTPPPVEKRDDRHAFAFIDMEKRWSLDEIRKELSKE